jgi:hypothetical protein
VAEQWSWEIYEREHGKDATAQFKRMVELLDSFATKKGWNLPFNLNKYYTGFKRGNRVVFTVSWGGTYTWNLTIKVPESIAKTFKGKNWEFQRYDSQFNEALFKTTKADVASVDELSSLLESAYEGATGKRQPN